MEIPQPFSKKKERKNTFKCKGKTMQKLEAFILNQYLRKHFRNQYFAYFLMLF